MPRRTPNDPPNILSFLDYREYLQAWLTHRRQEEPGYTFDSFAMAAELSRSTLPNILSGSRSPKPDTLDAFARAMDLGPTERNYLGKLVELDKAPSISRRREVLQQLVDLSAFRKTTFFEDLEEYGERWYHAVIRELAQRPSFRADPEWVARSLKPAISVQSAREALDTLFKLGLLEQSAEGTVEVPEIRVTSHTESQAPAVARFHREVVPFLVDQIDEVPAELRHLIGATFLLPDSLLPEAKHVLTLCAKQLLTMAEESADKQQRVYQLAIQLVPVSEAVD